MESRDPLDSPPGDLLRAASDAWRDFRAERDERFHLFIPADPTAAFFELRELRGHANSFLELGAGVGVITILADLLGFEAFGIEIEPELVHTADELAERFESQATFVEGSFVPVDYRDAVGLLDADFLTLTEGPDAFAELGMEIADFDVVYAYPWPGEEDWLEELVRRNAGERTMLLTYSVNDGFTRTEF